MPSRHTSEHWTEGVICESFRSRRHGIFAALLQSAYLGVVTVVAVIAKMIWPSVQPGPSGVSVLQVCLQILITLLVLPFAAALGWRNLGLTWRPCKGFSYVCHYGHRQEVLRATPALHPAYMVDGRHFVVFPHETAGCPRNNPMNEPIARVAPAVSVPVGSHASFP